MQARLVEWFHDKFHVSDTNVILALAALVGLATSLGAIGFTRLIEYCNHLFFGLTPDILTQAVGLDPAIEPEIGRFPAKRGDLYVLCSDGLSDLVPDSAIGTIVGTLAADLEGAAGALVATALNAGGHDNVTVVVVRDDQPRPARGKRKRRRGKKVKSSTKLAGVTS